MIDAIINGLLNFFMGIIDLFLQPINQTLVGQIPNATDTLALFGGFIDFVKQFFTWILSWFNIPHSVFQFGYFTAVACIAVPISLHIVKLGLAWYRKLMP